MIEIHESDAVLRKIQPQIQLRSDAIYVPSQFALPFEYRGKKYVFNNLTKQCIEGSLPPLTKAGEGNDDLIQGLFLVPEDKDECVFYNGLSAVVRAYNKKKRIQIYTILPTFGCNAKCIYCYEEGFKPVTMTSDTVEQTIRFILNTHESETVRLSWFGGEPLLRPDIIDRICEGLSIADLQYQSRMVSNGSLITPAIIEKMVEHWNLNSIQVSMDGSEEDYIARKQYPHYNDYYHKVLENVNALSKAGIQVTVRCNVDEANWNNAWRLLNDMEAEIDSKENVSLYFAPLNHVRGGKNDYVMWQAIAATRSRIKEAGFRVSSLLVYTEYFRINHCMADMASLVITPDGGLYPCEHCPPESRFGDIWNGITDETARTEFCRVDITREKCQRCPFLPNCTSFAACPVVDTHCREIQEMLTIDMLKGWIDKKEETMCIDEDSFIC